MNVGNSSGKPTPDMTDAEQISKSKNKKFNAISDNRIVSRFMPKKSINNK